MADTKKEDTVDSTVVNLPAENVDPSAAPQSDDLAAAREQLSKDEKLRRENPNSIIVREANPKFGGEAF